MAQTNRGSLYIYNPGRRIFNIVQIKFIDPVIEAIPAICKLNIAMSTEGPECAIFPDNGG
jgi:hypothetical protein